MSWITVIWSMIASACLTLAGVYFLVWWKNRTAHARFLFSLTATLTAVYAFFELWLMRTQTTQALDAALRWGQVPLSLWLVSLAWFVWTYLDAGRRWLAWTAFGLRALWVLPSLLMGGNPQFREIPSLQRVSFLGESITVAVGVAKPWSLLGPLSALLLLLFVADASVTVWRRGERRKAMVVGGSAGFFLITGSSMALLRVWAGLEVPLPLSFCFLGGVAVMGYELTRDVIRASELVHQLQASEAGLRESEARISLAVDAGDVGLWIWDLARDDMWGNDLWRNLFGFAPSGRLPFDDVLQRLHPDDREALTQTHATAFGGANGGRFQTEYRLMLPDGAIRWIASLGRVEVDDAGRPILLRGACREITARKKAEHETQLLRQEIAHAGRVSMIGQLAAALAHEINQPLAAMLRNVEAAELFLQHASPDLDEVRAILADIRADDQRAGQVIDRVRGLLKRQTLDTRPLEVGSLVCEVAALVRVDAVMRHVRLDVDSPGGLPYVRGDRVHLQQVLLNLILNGMDAVNGVRPEARRVSVTSRLDGAQMVEITVGDTGPGIPADNLAQIFSPFFTTRENGMGMGLAISRTIVESHGGRLWAENQQDGGAAFHFTLPIAAEAAAT